MFYVSDDDVPCQYLGSSVKRRKTMEQEEDDWNHADMVKNPHLYTDKK